MVKESSRKVVLCISCVIVFVIFHLWNASDFTQQHVATINIAFLSSSHSDNATNDAGDILLQDSNEAAVKGIPAQGNAYDIAKANFDDRRKRQEEEYMLRHAPPHEKPLHSAPEMVLPLAQPNSFYVVGSSNGPRRTPARFKSQFSPFALLGHNDKCKNATGTALDDCLKEVRLKVEDRVFTERFKETDLPCYHPTDYAEDEDFNDRDHVITAAKEGLFFLKLLKTASSTSAGVHLRIAHNRAKRQAETSDWPVCKTRQEHGFAGPKNFWFGSRNRDESVLWTVIRDPTDRTISEYFHLKVSRAGKANTDPYFINFLQIKSREIPHYLLRLWTKTFSTSDVSFVDVANEIMGEYDFIGVQGRYDESLVCLMMLWNVPMSDILYMPSKLSGGYDGGQQKDTCFYIPPREVSPVVEKFLDDSQWRRYVNIELALYEAANRSLDRTIDALGREDFALALELFQNAQEHVLDVCGDVVRFPCTKEGIRRPNNESDCLRGDSGCGFECLDTVATELDLW